MRVLFVCNQNMHRSKTAEEIFAEEFETKSAGLYNDTPIIAKDMEWADLVVVMEEEQRLELSKRFPLLYMQKQIVSLNLPDIYSYNHPLLVDLLKKKMSAILTTLQIECYDFP